MHGQLFSPAPVNDYRSVDTDPPVVEKFNHCERQDDRNGDQRHYGPKVRRVNKLWHLRMIHAVENVRAERSCACSDFDILPGLRGV